MSRIVSTQNATIGRLRHAVEALAGEMQQLLRQRRCIDRPLSLLERQLGLGRDRRRSEEPRRGADLAEVAQAVGIRRQAEADVGVNLTMASPCSSV